MSHVFWYLYALLGLITKPRVSGKKGGFPTGQHETPRNIYWGPQGMIWQLAKSNSLPEGVGSVRVQPNRQKPPVAQKSWLALQGGGGGLGQTSGICCLGKDLHFIMGVYTPDIKGGGGGAV